MRQRTRSLATGVRRVSVKALSGAIIFSGLLWRCNTPQIPLPPPVIEDMAFELTDPTRQLGRLKGSASGTPEMADSTVRVINLRDHYGVLAPADGAGRFQTREFEVRDGDQLKIDYTIGNETSESLCAKVGYADGLKRCPNRSGE